MSEKRTRETLEAIQFLYGPIWPYATDVQAALSEPPDVVSAAKETRQALIMMGGNPGDVVGPDPLSEKGQIWLRGYRQALADSVEDMQKAFGFRLTADGWEWVEEEAEDWEKELDQKDVRGIVVQGPEHGDFWVEDGE